MPWQILNGTLVNVVTVVLGSLAGLALRGKLPERYRTIVLTALGLVTVLLGVDAGVIEFGKVTQAYGGAVRNAETYGARLALVMIGSLLPGCVLGTALNLSGRIEALGALIHRRFSGGGAHRFAEAFLTASVLFCIGPLTLLGCLKNGAEYDPSFLYIKACLDGFSSIALASALGWGIFVSALTVLTVQSALSIAAHYLAGSIPPVSIHMMIVVGGVMLLATALNMLEVKRIPVADMLPSLFLPPILIALSELLWPNMLLPVSA